MASFPSSGVFGDDFFGEKVHVFGVFWKCLLAFLMNFLGKSPAY